MWEQLMWALQLTRRCAFGCWLAKGSRETENWEPFHLLGQFRTDEQNYLVFGRKTLLNIIWAYLNMAFPIPKATFNSSGRFRWILLGWYLWRHYRNPAASSAQRSLRDRWNDRNKRSLVTLRLGAALGARRYSCRFWDRNCLKEIDASFS